MLFDYSDPKTRRERYQALRSALWSDRSTFDGHWKELADWTQPRRTRFYSGDRNRGDKRNQNIIDSTARFAVRTLQSGLHAGLTSPARPWFKLTTPDPDLAEFKPVQEWLQVVTKRMRVIFASTNLYNALPTVYGDFGLFGTGAISVVTDNKDLFRCYTYPVGSYALGLDSRNIVSTFVRDYELTVRQVVEEFGYRPAEKRIDWSVISTGVKDLWDRGDYNQPVKICWVVTPNEQADADRMESRYLPWTSCHFEEGDGKDARFLRESGFRSFPILAPRWETTGEDTYGTDCPGMTALGDVKQLQMMQKEKAKAIKKIVDPPLVGAAELRSQKTSVLPGDITYVRDVKDGGLRAVHEIRIDLSHMTEDIAQVQYRIQRAFYEDLFLMLARSDQQLGADRPTAREIDERHEEKLLALGPVLERTNDELLSPLIDRAYEMMEEKGLIPDPPEALDGVKLKVEYVSILAEAQKLAAVAQQDRFVASVYPIAQTDPSILMMIDKYQLVANYRELLGVDPRIVISREDYEQAVQEQAQAAQQQAGAEQAAQLAKAAKDGSQAQMGQDSALDRIVGAAASGAIQ